MVATLGIKTQEQWWAFDTLGFLHIPAAVTVTLDALQPAVCIETYAAQLCGGRECVVDTAADGFGVGVLGGTRIYEPRYVF